MKRKMALFLSAAMALSLTACKNPTNTPSDGPSKSAESAESGGSDHVPAESQTEETDGSGETGVISSVVNLDTDWLPYDENGNLKLTERDAEGENGVVSSANYYASKIGSDIIADGGNAVDAAVAVGFAMSAVESYYSGLGGGGYMMIRFADTGENLFIDFRETAPTGATPDLWPKGEDGEGLPGRCLHEFGTGGGI